MRPRIIYPYLGNIELSQACLDDEDWETDRDLKSSVCLSPNCDVDTWTREHVKLYLCTIVSDACLAGGICLHNMLVLGSLLELVT